MANLDWRIRRVGQAVFTIWAVLTLTFVLIRVMPGNPLGRMRVRLIRQGMSPSRVNALIETRLSIDPNEPIPIAYVNYLIDFIQGNLGQSIYYEEPVIRILAEALPWTVFVLGWGIFISYSLSIVLGALMGYWEGGKLDVFLSTVSIVLGSIPFYVLAILFLIFLSYQAGWFPTGGRMTTGTDPGFNWPFISGIIYHATLPVMSYVVISGLRALGMRGNSIRVLGSDYLRVARLRGLSDLTISTQYVGRNAVLPLYTSFLISIGRMFGGSAILEEVFTYRGLGYYTLHALYQRDYPLLMGAFALLTIAVVLALVLADMTYPLIDPRAGGGSDESY
ncbi:MAG: ABC transporter permease [Haloarculaceae archaeon]